MKIACLTPVSHIPNVLENLKSLGEVAYYPYADYLFANSVIKNSDIIFVNPNKMTYRLDSVSFTDSSLKYIVTASTGTHHIDLEAAHKNNIQVISLTNASHIIEKIPSTAEHAFGLTLALIRNIPKAMTSVKAGFWDYEPYIGIELKNKTVGVIGYGRLGKMYADFARAFGCNVLYYDIKGDCDTLEDIQDKAHIISLHVHLNSSNWYMISYDFLSKLKQKPYLINTSRGDLVNEQALLVALENKTLSGYATDVLSHELGYTDSSPIVQAMDKYNIVVTPHIGGMTVEAQEKAYNGVIELLKTTLQKEKTRVL